MGEAEGDVQVPTFAQLLDRVRVRCARGFAGDVVGQAVLGDRVEEPALVPEEPVDGGCLHAGGSGDRARGRRVAAARGDESGGGGDDARAQLARVGGVFGDRVQITHRDNLPSAPCRR